MMRIGASISDWFGMLTHTVARIRNVFLIFGVAVACLMCVACGSGHQNATPAPSQSTAKAENGHVFKGPYDRKFADTYNSLQTGFARGLIEDGKISEKDINALEFKVEGCVDAQAQSEDDFITFIWEEGTTTPTPYHGANAKRMNKIAKQCMERYDGYKINDLSHYVYVHEHPDDNDQSK